MNWCLLMIFVVVAVERTRSDADVLCCKGGTDVARWGDGAWTIYPATSSWASEAKIPMTTDFALDAAGRQERGKFKVKKKFRKFLLPLLLAYKLKFFTLIPVLIGGLVLLTGATGLAGFFFALFAAVMGLKGSDKH